MNISTIFSSFIKNRVKSVIAISMIVLTLVSVSFLSSKVYAEDTIIDTSSEVVVTEEVIQAPVDTEVVVPEATPVVEEVLVEEVPATPAEETVSETANVISSQTPVTSPTLSTDKDDYHPGETATIFGKFFAPLQSFILKVFGSDDNDQNYVELVQTVTTDDSGSFFSTFTLDALYRPFYEMVVSTLDGTQLASGWFRDAAVDTYDQCSNDDGDGYSTGDTGCRWINGAINASNSVYQEGDATVQRLSLDGFAPNTQHTVTIQYGTTKQGKHAYDFLTTWTHSENWIAVADRCQGITGCDTAAEATFAIPNDTNGSGQFQGTVGARNFVMRGGTITAVTAPSLSGSYLADSETSMTITFTVPSSGPMCSTKGQVTSCGIALWFGAHIADGSDWTTYNGTTGAGSIAGSPYHVAVTALDGGSIGNRDNQMQAGSIPTQATLTLLKTVINDNGGTAVDTNWTLSANGPTPISGIEGNSAVTNTLVDAGVYTLSESSGPTGYTGGAYSCVKNGGPAVVSNSITLAASDVAVCTVTNNDIAPSLTLVKQVINDNGGNATAGQWTLTATGYDSQSPDAGTYNLSESNGPTGYAQTSLTCSNAQGQVTSVTLSLGENVTCTFVNNDIAPKLKVVKVVDNGNTGSTNTSSDFQMLVDNNGVTQGVSNTYSVGAHTVTETGPAGYTATYSGACNGTPTVTLALGDDATCTITNTAIAPTLTLIKTVTNDNGGTKVVADFILKIDATSVTSGVSNAVSAGAHTASEVNLSGYTAGTWTGDCDADGTVTLGLGENKTCTINNNDQTGTLIVKKVLINDNGGTAGVTSFSYKVNSGSDVAFEVDAQNDATVNAGIYSVVENASTGYATTYDNCSNIQIPNGGTATCTITNDDIAPVLHLRKVVTNDNGGTATVTDFTLTANGAGANDLSGTSPVDSTLGLKADTFALSETNVSGYSASAWSCVGGTQNGANITLGIGEEATCTITNDDIAPKLVINKIVVNDNGGTATINDFQGMVDGNNVAWSATTTLQAGAHTASESNLSGYTAGSWTGDCASDGSVSLSVGETKTCTITNNDIAPKLIVIKHVINDNGGAKVAGDFIMNITGTNVANASSAGVENPGTEHTLNAGNYSVDEGVHVGYDKTLSADCSGSIALGETKTCTITNDDQPAHLKLVKVVTNDNGGTAVETNFTLSATGSISNISGAGGAESDVNAGSYALSETSLTGYTASAWSCVGGNQSGSNVTLGLGESATCTITNDDIAPKLTLVKNVVNDNGGTATAGQWTLTATGYDSQSPDAGTYNLSESNGPSGYTQTSLTCDNAQGQVTSVTLGLGDDVTCTFVNDDNAPKLTLVKNVVNDNGGIAKPEDWILAADGYSSQLPQVGTYNLSESSGPAGYAQTSLTCSNSGSAQVTSVTLGLGDDVTCTFVNDDIQPKLKIVKTIINDNGGSKVVADFPLFVNTTSVTSGVSNGFNAGSYTASETSSTGYTPSAWGGDCAADGTVTLNIGDDKTCTITNDDIAPVLHLRKVVTNDNGGTATVTDFTLTANGAGANDLSGTSPVDSTLGLKADTFALSETNVTGYSASDWVCVGGTQNGANISLGLGEEATCTITNDDIAPKLTVIKHVINHGGSAVAGAFTMNVTGTDVSTPSFAGAENPGTQVTLDAGDYSVDENANADYTKTFGANCSGTIAVGEEKTCTITNEEKPAKLTIIKDAQPNDLMDFAFNGGQVLGAFLLDDDQGVADIGLNGDIDRSQSKVFNNINTGSYTVTETQPNQYWVSKSISCVNNANLQAVYPSTLNGTSVTVNLTPGSDVTCTFINEKISPTRTQGFWQTHTTFTSGKFTSLFPAGMKIGAISPKILNVGQLFGAYYSSIPKKTTNSQRTALDKARMTMLQQLVTAKLNCAAFSCSPGIALMISNADTAYAGTDASAIIALAGQLDAYNNSGDTIVIGNAGKATPKDSQSIADRVFWNILP